MATIAFRSDGSMVTGSKAKAAITSGTASAPSSVKTPRTNEQSAATAARNVATGHGTVTQVPGTETSSYVSNKGRQIINYKNPTESKRAYDAFGNYRDETGTLVHDPAYNTDGTKKATATDAATPTTDTTSDAKTEIETAQTGYQKELDNYIAELDLLKQDLDVKNQKLIDNIAARYTNRLAEMETINRATIGGLNVAGARSGRSRYATEIQGSLISAEESAGIQRLTALESERDQLILEAQKAATEKNFEVLNKKMEAYEKSNTAKRQAVLDLHNITLQNEDQAIQRAQEQRDILADEAALQKSKQEIVKASLDLYTPSMLEFNEDGTIDLPDQSQIDAFAEQLGVDSSVIESSLIAKQREYAKMSMEERKAAVDLAKAQQDLIPEDFENYEYAKKNYGFVGTPQEWVKKQGIYTGKTTSDNLNFDEASEREIAFAVLPMSIKNNVAESERYLNLIDKGLAEGKTPYEIADILMGYKIDKPDQFTETVRKYIALTNLTQPEIASIARLINDGNRQAAMTKIEDSIMQNAKKTDPDNYIGEATAKTATSRANALESTIATLTANNPNDNPIGVVKGTMEQWLGRLKSPGAQQIATQAVALVAEMRNRLSGTAVTESEARFLADVIPQLGDSPENFMIKLNNLKTQPLLQLNSVRSTAGLPTLDEQTLLNKKDRLQLYEESSEMQPKYRSLENFKNNATSQELQIFDDFAKQNTDMNEADIWAHLKERGVFNLEPQTSIKGEISAKFKDGTYGGQCGDFAHKLVDFPPVGDSRQEKIASVKKYGIPAEEWRKNPQVGDVIITNESSKHGHVAVINEILPDGTIRVSESNYKQKSLGPERISNDRTLSLYSPVIYGAIRGPLKT